MKRRRKAVGWQSRWLWRSVTAEPLRKRTLARTSVGRTNREALEFSNVADAVSGYQLNVDLSWTAMRLSPTTACRVGIDVGMRGGAG